MTFGSIPHLITKVKGDRVICVITVAEKTRPTDEQVAKMWDANDAGGGVAWREGGWVKWKKGLTMEEMQEFASKLPMPYILHFRIPSCGGRIDELCHPFPISTEAELLLEGRTKGYVLFHNGHWGKWKDFTVETALKKGNLPVGKWSDTRAMAWAAGVYGLGILDLIDEKTVAFGPKSMEFTVGTNGWDEVEKGNGLWVSNLMWKHRTVRDWRGGYDQLHGGFRRQTPSVDGVDGGDGGEHQKDDKGGAKNLRLISGGKSGGASKESPFELACKMYRERRLSRRQMKQMAKKFGWGPIPKPSELTKQNASSTLH